MEKKERNSSIEALRIAAMIMIITSHSCVHGLAGVTSNFILNNITKDILTLGNLGVAIFVIITGYVSVEKSIKISKILKLEFQIMFYSILFYIITTIINGYNIFSIELLKAFFPITFKKYWFMSAYMILYLLIPFINLFIKNIEKETFNKFLLMNIILVFIIPTITTSDLYFNELFQFLTFYLIGAYLKNNEIKSKAFLKKVNIFLVSSIILLICSSVLIELMSLKFQFLSKYGTYFFNRNSIFILVLATCIFIKTLSIKPFSNSVINTVASTTLGIYLIHDNPNFRSIIWNRIFDLSKYINEYYFIIMIFLTTFIIFIISFLIELLRKTILDKFIEKIISKLNNKITKQIERRNKNEEKNRYNEHAAHS